MHRDDLFKPTNDLWLCPDVFKNRNMSIALAKTITGYKKAVGHQLCLAELMVLLCERAVGFSNDVGFQDEAASSMRGIPRRRRNWRCAVCSRKGRR